MTTWIVGARMAHRPGRPSRTRGCHEGVSAVVTAGQGRVETARQDLAGRSCVKDRLAGSLAFAADPSCSRPRSCWFVWDTEGIWLRPRSARAGAESIQPHGGPDCAVLFCCGERGSRRPRHGPRPGNAPLAPPGPRGTGRPPTTQHSAPPGPRAQRRDTSQRAAHLDRASRSTAALGPRPVVDEAPTARWTPRIVALERPVVR